MCDHIIRAWDDLDPSLPLEERITQVESIIRAFRDQAALSNELTLSIERLGANAEQLVEQLGQIEQNARAVARLDIELERTKQSVVPREELQQHEEATAERLRWHRRQVLRRAYTAVLLTVAAICGTALVALAYFDQEARQTERFRTGSYQVCQQRNAQSIKLTEFFARQRRQIGSLPPAQRQQAEENLALLEQAFPVVDCEPLR